MKKHSGATSPKMVLSLLAILFFVPLSVAWLMYSGTIEFSLGAGVNKGELINPPVQARVPEEFSELGLSQHWVLSHALPQTCDEACLSRLHGMRQVIRALGRDAVRVRVLLLTEPGTNSSNQDEFQALDPSFSVIDENTGKLSQQFELLGDRDGIFIIDPLGNIMMRYAQDSAPDDILSDMERLLQYQKTDPQ